jgi:hypothetical protein
MERCPACGSYRIYPSRVRSISDRLRRLFTARRPYRCHECDCRRWAPVLEFVEKRRATLPDDLRAPRSTQALKTRDLDQLDPC